MDGSSASRTSLPHAGLSTSVAGEWIKANSGKWEDRVRDHVLPVVPLPPNWILTCSRMTERVITGFDQSRYNQAFLIRPVRVSYSDLSANA